MNWELIKSLLEAELKRLDYDFKRVSATLMPTLQRLITIDKESA